MKKRIYFPKKTHILKVLRNPTNPVAFYGSFTTVYWKTIHVQKRAPTTFLAQAQLTNTKWKKTHPFEKFFAFQVVQYRAQIEEKSMVEVYWVEDWVRKTAEWRIFDCNERIQNYQITLHWNVVEYFHWLFFSINPFCRHWRLSLVITSFFFCSTSFSCLFSFQQPLACPSCFCHPQHNI